MIHTLKKFSLIHQYLLKNVLKFFLKLFLRKPYIIMNVFFDYEIAHILNDEFHH